MVEWDRISWVATALFILALVLGAVAGSGWLYLMAAAYLLRPTLYALGRARRSADERQIALHFRSGNLAFTILIVAIAAYAVRAEMQGQQVGDFVTLIIIGLAAKALTGLMLNGDPRSAGVRITMAAGLSIALFTSLEGGTAIGMLMQALPGLLLIGAGLIGRWKPLAGAVLLGVLCIASFVYFGPVGQLTTARMLMAVILTLPLGIAAWCFWRAARQSVGEDAVPPGADHRPSDAMS